MAAVIHRKAPGVSSVWLAAGYESQMIMDAVHKSAFSVGSNVHVRERGKVADPIVNCEQEREGSRS